MIISYPLITILYTKRYEASVPIFQMYLLLIPIRSISFGLLLRAAGKTKYDFYGSILFFVIATGLIMFTIRSIGIYGPAIAIVISVYLLGAFLLVNIKRELGFRIRDTICLNTCLRIILLTVLPAMLFLFIVPHNRLESIKNSSLCLISYGTFIVISYKWTGKWEKLQLRKA